ncbi:MAG: N-acetyl sugar amidotransferase [Candidatus Omnitrophica bacterium]|nr:N-acetyl sugar amidotransferase [Candidatus Omnitrophota bacterium]
MSYITNTKRCVKCILPEQYPDIQFDSQGVCHKCHEQEAKYINRDYEKLGRELDGIFRWAKAQKKRYDCIVPFSGGKDSSYTLYLCRKKYGLKVLAVNFNNGLRTPEALMNMENIVKKTDCAYACYGPNWEVLKKLYREFVLKAGHFCFVCDMGIWATIHRLAEQYDVPLIVSEFSSQIESRGPKIYSYNNKFFRTIASEVVDTSELKDFLEETAVQKILRRFRHGRFTRYRRQISLPDYVVWDDKEIKDTIYKELGWQKRADGSSDHIDCLFAPMKNYLVVQKWGFGEKTTKYSAMVRAGQMGREEALRRAEAEESQDVSGHIKVFLKELGLSEQELLQAKTRSHLDYL